MSENVVNKEVILDQDVYHLLQEFWELSSNIRPPHLKYLYIAGSSVNGGREIVRRDSQTLAEGDIDITYVATAIEENDLRRIQDYIKRLTSFFDEKKRAGAIQFSEIHVSSSRLLDNPIPNEPMMSVDSALDIMNGVNTEKISAIITQMCLPTVPQSIGENNKLFIAQALEKIKSQDRVKYDALVKKIKEKWQEMMRWKNKYKGENKSEGMYAAEDYSEVLALQLIGLLANS